MKEKQRATDRQTESKSHRQTHRQMDAQNILKAWEMHKKGRKAIKETEKQNQTNRWPNRILRDRWTDRTSRRK